MIGDLIERFAVGETGRVDCPAVKDHIRTCIVYPDYLFYAAFISVRGENYGNNTDHYRFECRSGWFWRKLISLSSHLYRIIRLARQSDTIETYSFSSKLDFPFLFVTAMMCRLFGVKIIHHDFCFNQNNESGKTQWLYCLSDLVMIGDETRRVKSYLSSTAFAHFCEFKNLAEYRKTQNESIAPRVMIYGDFELKKNISIVNGAFEIVKQKYPRTEFILICPTFYGEDRMAVIENKPAIDIARPEDENHLRDIYAEADILAVLSSGGLNRYFIKRAYAAGCPVILNDINYSNTFDNRKCITISRDSYSSLASEIIKLVDDKDYYGTFSER
ncbi:MAG: hypothetical protein V3V99_09370 [candidate division Zixibacteria bacterium]